MAPPSVPIQLPDGSSPATRMLAWALPVGSETVTTLNGDWDDGYTPVDPPNTMKVFDTVVTHTLGTMTLTENTLDVEADAIPYGLSSNAAVKNIKANAAAATAATASDAVIPIRRYWCK